MSLREPRVEHPAARSAALDAAKAERRQRAGVLNRRLGWVILPLVLAAFAIHWGPDGYHGWLDASVAALQVVFIPLTFLHVALSVYVFGWVPWRRTLRVFHIWFGYAYLGFMLAAQTTFLVPDVHRYLTAAMLASLAVHVGIGIYFARRRASADTRRGLVAA